MQDYKGYQYGVANAIHKIESFLADGLANGATGMNELTESAVRYQLMRLAHNLHQLQNQFPHIKLPYSDELVGLEILETGQHLAVSNYEILQIARNKLPALKEQILKL